MRAKPCFALRAAAFFAALLLLFASVRLPPRRALADGERKKAELVFVIDSTASMGDEINNVKTRISAFSSYLESFGVMLRIGIIEYRDYVDDGPESTVVHELGHSVWLESAEQMEAMLGSIEVGGGGDQPETVLDGLGFLADGRSVPWSSDSYRFAVVLTDASFKTDNRHGYGSLRGAAEKLLEKGINASAIVPAGRAEMYAPLAEVTGGIIADINSDFDAVLEGLADSILGLTRRSPRAIYILPDSLASYLFEGAEGAEGGAEVWPDGNIEAYRQAFIQDESGSGTGLHAEIREGEAFISPLYNKLVQRLASEFSADAGGKYDIVIFPFNWAEDIDSCAARLEAHVLKSGYSEVVFAAHGTGGLVAARYIARSAENKLKVKKAVLISAPLLGSCASLLAIEAGDLSFAAGLFGGERYFERDFAASCAKNSPAAYSLLPGEGYLAHSPFVYGSWALPSAGSAYAVLAKSAAVNSGLLSKADQYSAVAPLMEVDALLIGSSGGFTTPQSLKYSIPDASQNAVLEDVVFTRNGDGALPSFSAMGDINGALPLRCDFSYDSDHFGILQNDRAIEAVCRELRGHGPASSAPAENAGDMSGLIKIDYSASVPVAAVIRSADGEIAAYAERGQGAGFDGQDMIFLPLTADTSVTDAIIYMPSAGYSIEFSCDPGASADFTAEFACLTADGARASGSVVTAETADEYGVLASLDCTSAVVSARTLVSMCGGASVNYRSDWRLPESVSLEVGETYTASFSGADAAFASANAVWSSGDTATASVSAEGVITAAAPGVASVFASDGNRAECITVIVTGGGESLSFGSVLMAAGERRLVSDPETLFGSGCTYSSDNADVLEISALGVMHALAPGEAGVTVRTASGASGRFAVTVKDTSVRAVESVEIPAAAFLEAGETLTLAASVFPEDASEQRLRWFVDDAEILELTAEEGSAVITAFAPGQTLVTAVSRDGGYCSRCLVTVAGDPEPSALTTVAPTPAPTAAVQTSAPTPAPSAPAFTLPEINAGLPAWAYVLIAFGACALIGGGAALAAVMASKNKG